MTCRSKTRRARLGTAFVALAIGLGTVAAPAPAVAQSGAARPSETLNLSAGTGTLVRLPAPMSDVFVANDAVADVQVRSNRQLYIFGKGRGETTVYATGANGKVVYAANVRVGNNLGSVDEMLRLAMPEASVRARRESHSRSCTPGCATSSRSRKRPQRSPAAGQASRVPWSRPRAPSSRRSRGTRPACSRT